MSRSEPACRITKGSVCELAEGSVLTLALACVAFAALIAASRVTRLDSMVPQDSYFLFRIAQITTYFCVAFLFRNNLPPVKELLLVGTGACACHLALSAATSLGVFSEAYVTPVLWGSRVVLGVGIAIAVLVSLHMLCTYAPMFSTFAILGASFAMEAVLTAASSLSQAAMTLLQGGCIVCGLGCTALCMARKRRGDPIASEHPLQYGVNFRKDGDRRPLSFLTNGTDWVFQMIVAFLLPTIFGFFSQMTSSTGFHESFAGLSSEYVGAATCLGVLVVSVVWRPTWDFFSMFIPVAALYATGLALLPLCWEQGWAAAGTLIACGLNIYKPLLLVLIARKAFDDPRHTYLYAGVFMGHANALYGRLLEPLVVGSAIVDYRLVTLLTLSFLWLLVILCLSLFAMQRRMAARRTTRVAATAPQTGACVPPASTGDGNPFALGVDLLTRQANLTPREREVLIETLHGYTMAGVAQVLSISVETVRTHMKRIYAKAQVTNKQALIKKIASLANSFQ